MVLIEENSNYEDDNILINSEAIKKGNKNKTIDGVQIKKMEKEKKRLLSIFDSITELQEQDSYNNENIKDLSSHILSSLNSCFSNMSTVIQAFGTEKDLTLIVSKKDLPDVGFTYADNILKITLPTLLPRRINYGEKQYSTELKRISLMYGKVFADYFEEHPHTYDRRVVLCFINHFSTSHTVKDHDNFDIKLIIDYIASGVLADDSPSYCSHYMDYKIDGRDFSEIFVVPEDRFSEFLESIRKD